MRRTILDLATRILVVTLLLAPLPAQAAAIALTENTPDVATLGTTLQEYQLPAGCRWVQIYSASVASYLQWTGTDGAAKSTDNLIIPANSWLEWRIPGTGYGKDHARSTISIYIAASASSTSVTVQCTTDGD